MGIFDKFRERKNALNQININVLNFDAFYTFLGTLGFKEVDSTEYHITYEDCSEERGIQLAYNGKDCALLGVRYIDSHFWPKSEKGENIYRDEDPKWRVGISPVSISLHPKVNLPPKVLYALQNYSDNLPEDPEAKKSYEQYMEINKTIGDVSLNQFYSLSLEQKRAVFRRMKVKSAILRPLPAKSEEVKETIEHCDRALEMSYNHIFVWVQKISCLIDLYRNNEALSCCEIVFTIPGGTQYPVEDFLWMAKGLCCCRLGKYEEAILCYDTSLKLNSKNPTTWRNKGIAFKEIKRYEEGIHCYNKALEIDPADSNTYIERGFAYMMIDQYELAIVDCNKAVEIAPQNAESYFMRAVAKTNTNQVELAILDYNKAIELKPLHFRAYFMKALTCEKTGRFEEARETLKKLIKNTPSQYSDVIQRAREELENYKENNVKFC